jgi:hypothetical protein
LILRALAEQLYAGKDKAAYTLAHNEPSLSRPVAL